MLVQTFVDTSRPTADHGSVPGAPSRTLRTTVLFPATADGGPPDTTAGPYPLVVFAHGSGGLGTDYFPMLRSWAAAGYVVAAPEFPVAASGPDGRQGDSSSIEDLANQPADMSFLVTQLLAATTPIHDVLDPNRVGAPGHSLGAMATLAVTENTCCRDERMAKGGHSTMYDPFDAPAAQLTTHLTVAFLDTCLKGATDGPSRLHLDPAPAGLAKLESET